MPVSYNTIDPGAAKKVQNGTSGRVMDSIARLGMSPRQQDLNRMWAAYRGLQYASRKVGWDGMESVRGVDAEAIATAGFIPPGYYDAGATFPLKFRRPSAPYHLRKVVVDRFSGLLFSERRHPRLVVEGDPETEDYVRTLAEVARLWPAMVMARTYGGAMGSVALGFQFLEGRPLVEVHDPRWTHPTFKDRYQLVLESVEKRYMYPVDERDEETGAWKQVAYWYRRVIDETSDTLYQPCKVDNEEPVWKVANKVTHNFGFCPVVWVQNLPVQDDIDGDSDCMGIEDLCEQIDALLSQATQGVLANCDPTLRIVSDADLDSIKKGSKNAIKLPAGSSADYMELSGSGPKAATEMADKLRELALEVAQCVLDHPDVANRTATEVERVYSSMLAKADVLREQYGERGVKPLVEMMLKAAQTLGKPKQTEEGMVRETIDLPKKATIQSDGTVAYAARVLGQGGVLTLAWTGYFPSTITDAKEAVTAATGAKTAGLIDTQTAITYVAPHFNVENPLEIAKRIKEEAEATQAAMDQSSMMGGGGYADATEDTGEYEEEQYPEEEATEETGEEPVEE
jgi:hypothetical protein